MGNMPVSESIKIEEDMTKNEYVFLLGTSVLLGVLFEVFFYEKSLGISYPLFVSVFYGVLLWNMRNKISFGIKFEWLLSIPVIMLSLTYFIFSNEIFKVLNFLAIPILVTAQTIIITDNNKFRWDSPAILLDIIGGFFYRPFAHILKPFRVLSALICKNRKVSKHSKAYKVLAGLVISIPIILVIAPLLSSADQIFSSFIDKIPDVFSNVDFREGFARIFIIIFVSAAVFSYIWSLAGFSLKNPELPGNMQVGRSGAKREKRAWDAVVVITMLTVINIIYFVFVIIQFAYLFGGIKYNLSPGFTYSEYARRGFFELVAVTIINLNIFLLCMYYTKAKTKVANLALKVMYSVLTVCTVVMLFSAYYRMSLYEDAYGYTYLRVLTHMFMIFLFIIFLIAFVRIWNKGIPLMKYSIIVSIAAYVIVNYVNIDVLIAEKNIERYERTGSMDVQYLSNLSYDSIKEVAKLLDSKDKNISRHVENYLYRRKEELSLKKPWESFNLSEYRAKKVLSQYNLTYEAINSVR